ncbi:MAG: thermonuclease family protein [Caulobacter sp.]|nr:thermonuclease family protein [Caulobacter sp.]
MFRVSRIILALAVLGAVWYFWPFGKYDDVVPVSPPQPDTNQTNTAQDQLFTKPLSKEAAAPQDAASPDEGAREQPKPKAVLRPKRFYRVVVQDGGSLTAGDTTITLAEIEVAGLTGQCKDSRGQAWPCGRAARSALTRLIRGRAVMCHVPVKGDHKSLVARCSVGGNDLSFWMVAQGWAKPKQPAQAAFKEAAEAARERRVGIWR